MGGRGGGGGGNLEVGITFSLDVSIWGGVVIDWGLVDD